MRPPTGSEMELGHTQSRHSSGSRGDWREARNEGPPISNNAPHSREQLSHSRNHFDLARLARGPKTLIILTQPLIAADSIENHHPERLA